jgi:transposase-like protein
LENQGETDYVKRIQKECTMCFKLPIVQEIERGFISISQVKKDYCIQSRSTIVQWLRKFDKFDWENQTPSNMPKSRKQRIMDLN